MTPFPTTRSASAIVAKSAADAIPTYLLVTPHQVQWVTDPDLATSFGSMREATQVATRLPAALRAFGFPVVSAAGADPLH